LWAENGLLDVVCPMAYTTDMLLFTRQVEEAVRRTGAATVWAGIGAYRLTPLQTVAFIATARSLGTSGVVLFSYDTMAAVTSPASYLDVVGRQAFGAPSPSGQIEER
jgi:hypothetical protein